MREHVALARGGLYRCWYRWTSRSIRIGRGLRVYGKMRISGLGRVEIGEDCVVGGMKGSRCQHVTIDAMSADSVIRIGDRVGLFAARISSMFGIEVGDDVLIEEAGIVDTDFHSIERSRATPADESRERCRVRIGDRVSIGARSFVTKGVTIGEAAVIAPGSIVVASVPPAAFVCGNPAKPSERPAATRP